MKTIVVDDVESVEPDGELFRVIVREKCLTGRKQRLLLVPRQAMVRGMQLSAHALGMTARQPDNVVDMPTERRRPHG